MKIICSAQSFGFGPASKLCTLMHELLDHDLYFIGEGVASRYIKLNMPASSYGVINKNDLISFVKEHGAENIAALMVMEPEITFILKSLGVRTVFVDSLFDFWRLDKPSSGLMFYALNIINTNNYNFSEHLERLTFHELQIVAHLISDYSIIQHGLGVKARVHELGTSFSDNSMIVQPIVPNIELAAEKKLQKNKSNTLLLNLGGIINPFTSIDIAREYLELIITIVRDTATILSTKFDQVIISHGVPQERQTLCSNGLEIIASWLERDEYLKYLKTCKYFATAPGLTAYYEALSIGILPALLPEQHYGHYVNYINIKTVHPEIRALSLFDMGLNEIVEDDLTGTRDIHSFIYRIKSEEKLYETFKSQFLEVFLNTESKNQTIDSIEATEGMILDSTMQLIRDVIEGNKLNKENIANNSDIYDK